MALRIVALILIALLLLFPAARMLGFLRSDKQSRHPILREGSSQIVEQAVIPVLVLAFLTVAVLMHFWPF